jgi:hypothetical protein
MEKLQKNKPGKPGPLLRNYNEKSLANLITETITE